MRRKAYHSIFGNGSIKQSRYDDYKWEKTEKSIPYCMKCCCHGCKALPIENPEKPRSRRKSLKHQKFYESKLSRNNYFKEFYYVDEGYDST